jgi:TP901 family phage tail tape measure protein
VASLNAQLIISLVDRVTEPARRVQKTVAELNGRIEKNNAQVAAMRGRVFGAAAGVAAIGAALWKPITAAADFEAAMNRVRAALTASDEETAALAAKARELGETTQFSASEAADAIEMLAKNGLSAAQILGGGLENSLLLAASAGTDLASAGDLITDVMLNFGKGADELGAAADGVTGVLLASKFGFDDYRLALAQAGGVAGGLGVELEDFNAVIAATSPAFGSGSDAGTSFKTFLQRLVPQSKKAAAAMHNLGLDFFNADGGMKSMAEIAGELQDGLSGLSEEARNEALSTIFGTDAMRTAIGLMREGEEGVRRLEATIAGASAAEQASARMKGFWGMIREVRSVLESLAISIGDTLLPALTDFGKMITPLIGDLSRRVASNPGLTKAIIMATGALMTFRLAVLGLRLAGLMAVGGALRTMAGGLGLIAATAAPLRRAGEAWRSASQAAALADAINPGTVTVWTRMGGAFKGIAGATGLRVVAVGVSAVVGAVGTISAPVWVGIAAAVAAVGLAWRHWDRVSAIARGVGKALSEAFAPEIEALQPLLEPVGTLLQRLVRGFHRTNEAIGKFVGGVRDFFGAFADREILTADQEKATEDRAYRIARQTIQAISILAGPFTQVGRDAIMGLWNGMKEKLDELKKWLGSLDLASYIPSWLKNALPRFGGDEEPPPDQPHAAGGWFRPGGVRVGEHGEERLYASQAGYIAHHRAVRQLAEMASRVAIPQPRALQPAMARVAGGPPVITNTFNVSIEGGTSASADDIGRALGREVNAAMRSHFSDVF